MITITIVRHGESTDNLKAIWAGWADAPLSNHGMNQAKALGISFSDVKVDAIFTSPLRRALWTAQQIERNQLGNKPPMTISPLLREQHFGVAEGKPFGGGIDGYVRQPGRVFTFPEGESLDDVRNRANEAISMFIEPELHLSLGKPPSSKHLVVVAHGIFNSELLGALMARRLEGVGQAWGYRGMTNTGWTRMEIGFYDELQSSPRHASITPSLVQPTRRVPSLPAHGISLLHLNVRVLGTDITSHLEGVHRQKGGIGSAKFDEKQSDLRAFFAGAQNE